MTLVSGSNPHAFRLCALVLCVCLGGQHAREQVQLVQGTVRLTDPVLGEGLDALAHGDALDGCKYSFIWVLYKFCLAPLICEDYKD